MSHSPRAWFAPLGTGTSELGDVALYFSYLTGDDVGHERFGVYSGDLITPVEISPPVSTLNDSDIVPRGLELVGGELYGFMGDNASSQGLREYHFALPVTGPLTPGPSRLHRYSCSMPCPKPTAPPT